MVQCRMSLFWADKETCQEYYVAPPIVGLMQVCERKSIQICLEIELSLSK